MKHILYLCMTALVVACTPTTVAPPTATPAVINAASTVQTPVATPTAVEASAITLHVWLPDALAGLDSVDTGDVLSEQISSFESAYPNIEIDLRLRATMGSGGILETMRSASAVAPSALPDITLLRYSDFRAAIAAGLVPPLDEGVLIAEESFAPSVYTMSIVDGQAYGIPAALQVLHVAYRERAVPIESWRFADLLDAQIPVLFPGAPATGISPVFLLQYVTAGADTNTATALTLSEPALRATLRYYERAAAANLVPTDVLEYDTPERYQDALLDGTAVVVTSEMYLRALQENVDLATGYVPTVDGEATTLLDGWLWVVLSDNGSRRPAALEFVQWMMATERQTAYMQTIHMLPARLAAQQALNPAYADFIDGLLQNAYLPLPDSLDGTTARALQTAFASVISGQSSANDALDAALAQGGN
ncbi:MAG: extracellular solute-binding protein [Chloroflexota bacterium]|nr:extracellular solute-binding protein [Chloroflexota bacterium]